MRWGKSCTIRFIVSYNGKYCFLWKRRRVNLMGKIYSTVIPDILRHIYYWLIKIKDWCHWTVHHNGKLQRELCRRRLPLQRQRITVEPFQAIPLETILNIIRLTVHIFLSYPRDVYTGTYDICSPGTDLIKHSAASLDFVFDSEGFLTKSNTTVSHALLQYNLIIQGLVRFPVCLCVNKNKLKCLEWHRNPWISPP